ncbi:DUF2384 domain-containing protein [Bradyrhizobium barranii subsp. barranii]|uniref:DUF2384 domain-containing protein n=1 Tax=Bradyrhizobium barranii subsp. barranii TaxID=2823807 RepID=A0A939M711_9BRAD|nr:antitoxin Xre/MbcA/ParS toxin-binding domain-containing protein [Bradyrhizobium barranii]UEM16783.1 DUF2384 domain-containing protein [Bradyrhizobium barranii subsp. barranii]
MTLWNEIARKLFQRWGASAYPAMDRDQVGKLLAISIGLGALFNEDAEAERNWMHAPHQVFRGRPLTKLLAGHIDQVLDQVNKERNL